MGKNWIYRSLFTIRSDQMSKFTFMYTHYPVASVGCPQSIKTQHTKLVDSFWQWSILQKNSTTWYPGVSLMSDVNKNGSWMIHDGCNHENCHAMMQGNPCMMQHQGGHFHVSCLLKTGTSYETHIIAYGGDTPEFILNLLFWKITCTARARRARARSRLARRSAGWVNYGRFWDLGLRGH